MAHRDLPVARGPQLLERPPRRRNRWKLAAILLLIATVALTTALVGSWLWFRHLALVTPQPVAPTPAQPKVLTPAPVTPLLLQYKLDLPGRGEIFPAMSSAARDDWPVAVLTISNSAERPALQVVTARVAEWTDTMRQTLVLAPGETRVVRLSPGLLPRAYQNGEVVRATLDVNVTGEDRQ